MRRFMLAVYVVAAICCAGIAFGSEGEGTGDFCERHGCGAPTDPGSVTPCPDVTCPDVTCQATDCSKTTVIVPPCPSPNYYPCRRTKHGIICPRPATPHRVLMPESEAKQYGAGK